MTTQLTSPDRSSERAARLTFDEITGLATPIGLVKSAEHAVAPIRTKPRRTYDGFEEDEYSPEGTHVPSMLAGFIAESDDQNYKQVKSFLATFARNSGMFRDVSVRALGFQPSAPFQLVARMPGITANLTDVGYGVSQVLPVLVECATFNTGQVVTMQQPEVHLHPRAQAELGSLFTHALRDAPPNTMMVVETHSDYLLNRVRREVAAGVLPPEDVSLLFFEKREAATRIHNIELDRLGNVVKAPVSYRKFFVDEELALLTRGEL
jgi:hypothetical protein